MGIVGLWIIPYSTGALCFALAIFFATVGFSIEYEELNAVPIGNLNEMQEMNNRYDAMVILPTFSLCLGLVSSIGGSFLYDDISEGGALRPDWLSRLLQWSPGSAIFVSSLFVALVVSWLFYYRTLRSPWRAVRTLSQLLAASRNPPSGARERDEWDEEFKRRAELVVRKRRRKGQWRTWRRVSEGLGSSAPHVASALRLNAPRFVSSGGKPGRLKCLFLFATRTGEGRFMGALWIVSMAPSLFGLVQVSDNSVRLAMWTSLALASISAVLLFWTSRVWVLSNCRVFAWERYAALEVFKFIYGANGHCFVSPSWRKWLTDLQDWSR